MKPTSMSTFGARSFGHPTASAHKSESRELYPHWLMFLLLRISPSYEKARCLAKGYKVDNLPKDFERVRATYEVLGDVRCDFRLWWYLRGQDAFGPPLQPRVEPLLYLPPKDPIPESHITGEVKNFMDSRKTHGDHEAIILAVPLGLADPWTEVRRIVEAYEQELKTVPIARRPPKMPMLTDLGKIKVDLIAGYIDRLLTRLFTKYSAWEIEAKYRPDRYSATRVTIGLRNAPSSEKEYRITLSQTFSRVLRHTMLYAEQAARGSFPLCEPTDDLAYDFKEIAERLKRIKVWFDDPESEIGAAYRRNEKDREDREARPKHFIRAD